MPVARRIDLAFLGAALGVESDDGALLQRLDAALGAFRCDTPAPDLVEVRLHDGPPSVRTGTRAVALEHEDPVGQAAAIVFRELLDRVEDFVLLHAAALERDGRAVLVGGPSGAGKTTLALALVRAGLRLLSDDFAPLGRADGFVHAFPKALGLREGAGLPLARALTRGVGHVTGRMNLAAARLAAESLARGPARPAALVLFNGAPEPPDPGASWRLAVAVVGPLKPVREALAALPGVSPVGERPGLLLFDIAPGPGHAALLEAALAAQGHRIVEHGPVAAHPLPTPDQEPRLVPLAPSQALFLLLREVQNRRPSGALWRAVGGDPLRLAAETARLLAGVPPFWLVPGAPGPTAELIAATLARGG